VFPSMSCHRSPAIGGAKHGKHTNCLAAALADIMMNQPFLGSWIVLELYFKALQVQQQAQGYV
jgi:hypothetical protein